MNSVERLVVTLKLRKGTQEQAAKLIAAGPPFDPGDLGLARHAVYLGNDLVIFAFEGKEVEERVRMVIDDPGTRHPGLAALIERHPQYREHPPAGPLVVVSIERWSGWSST